MSTAELIIERQGRVGRTGERSAEWALWFVGIVGSMTWIATAAFRAGFSYGHYVVEPPLVELMVSGLVAAIPSALHLTAIVAAFGLGRGSSWGVPLGRIVGVVLVAVLPLSMILSGSPAIDESLGRQLLGVPPGGDSQVSALIVVQAALGGLALWGLRRSRELDLAPPAVEPRPRRVTRAGWIIVGLGIWPALLIAIALGAGIVDRLDGDEAVDLPVLSFAGLALLILGVGVGRGILAERRWSLPAAPPTVLVQAILVGLLTGLVAYQLSWNLLSGLAFPESGDSPISPIAMVAAVIGIVLLAIYALVAVLRSRSRFVDP